MYLLHAPQWTENDMVDIFVLPCMLQLVLRLLVSPVLGGGCKASKALTAGHGFNCFAIKPWDTVARLHAA